MPIGGSSNRLYFWFASFCFVLTLIWFALTYFTRDAFIEIGQDQLQAKVAEKFPTKQCQFFVCLELSNPLVSMKEGADRIGFTANVNMSAGKTSLNGQIAFSGKVRYVRYEGDFYFDDVVIDSLDLAGFAPDFAEVVKVRGSAIAKALLQNHKIYQLKGDSSKAALAKLALRDVKVANGKLRISFTQFSI